jgi:1-acyl-sn-glycerol-3-phosphate acyltransferase
VDRVAREVFERSRRAAPAPAGLRAAPAGEAAPLSFVSCGRPLPGHEVRIVDAAGAAAGERVEGRVEFRGPSVTSGYFKNLEATRAVLRDGWMDSGDLGYQADGEVFVTGRRKDLIIKAGRNLYPQEVEEVAGDVPGIRKGCVAAFGLADPGIGTERLVVVAESRERAPERRERLRAAVVDRVVQALGIPPDLVVIAAPGAVSKTSSGKIRRSATREAFLGGALGHRRPSAARQWARVIATDLGARLRGAGASAARLAFAARVGLVLVVAFPILAALLRVAPARATDRVVRRWCRTVLALVGVGLVVEGGERLVATGGAVLVANHASYLDAMALLAAIPAPFRFVAKRELARAPLVGAVIERAGHLTVDRTDLSRSVADAGRVSAALAHGDSVLVFPEGTFVRAPGLLPFRLGAFKAAVEAGRPVFPIALRGTRSILPAGTWLPRRGTVTVTISEPLVPEPGGWREVVRLRDLAREAIGRASGEPV